MNAVLLISTRLSHICVRMSSSVEAARVLVTGASGYIATHVVQQLLQTGKYRVRGTVRSLNNPTKINPIHHLCSEPVYPLELVEADLMKEEGWMEAVRDCTYVIHMASPFPAADPRDEQEVIQPAVDGTLKVLQAVRRVGGVKRVVLTSSVASISGGFGGGTKPFTESDWTDPSDAGLLAYIKSKTLAEQAAWDFIKDLPEGEKFELAVINPGFVMGPVLCGSFATSMEIVQRLLERSMPALPKLNFAITDVRDVAQAHIRALVVAEAVGHRHIIVTGNIWVADIAKIIDAEFKALGYSIPTTTVPKFFIVINSLFDKSVRSIVPSIGKVTDYDNTRMQEILGIKPIALDKTIIDMSYSMIEGGHVKKTDKYKKSCTAID